MRYFANAPADQEEMLQTIGAASIDDLFKSIPEDIRFKGELDLGPAMSEQELLEFFTELAGKNDYAQMTSFLGAGMYPHFSPSHIDQMIMRSEFYTAYTPYQPEIAQGTLQTIFEFQTMMTMLTGLEVSNASLWDGATACSEAVLMADRIQKKRNKVLFSGVVHPQYREVTDTYINHLGLEVETIPTAADGRTDLQKAAAAIDENTAVVVLQSPNFLGVLEDVEAFAEMAHEKGALLAVSVNEALSFAIVKSPGELGADIVSGDGQSFGLPLNNGGPSVGFFTTRNKFIRQMPGRLVGQTNDLDGKRGFVLTLATREQHIRREKATSNICTNQGLFMALATIYLTTMGKAGLRELAIMNLQKANYLKTTLASIKGVKLPYSGPSFNEFVVELPKPAAEVVAAMKEKNIVAGLDLGKFNEQWKNHLLVCATELTKAAQIDNFAKELEVLL
jgi:glycine dehydrogenase subunit 1